MSYHSCREDRLPEKYEAVQNIIEFSHREIVELIFWKKMTIHIQKRSQSTLKISVTFSGVHLRLIAKTGALYFH